MNNDLGCASNALSELDQPAEYYVNKRAGLLPLIIPTRPAPQARLMRRAQGLPAPWGGVAQRCIFSPFIKSQTQACLL
jgi:hypothetical protein